MSRKGTVDPRKPLTVIEGGQGKRRESAPKPDGQKPGGGGGSGGNRGGGQPPPNPGADVTEVVRPLGYVEQDGSIRYYFYSQSTHQVIALTPTQLKQENLLSLCPSMMAWSQAFPSERGGFNVKMAAGALMALCHGVGYYNPTRRRRRGAWFEDGKVILNTGTHLLIDGEKVHYRDHRSAFIYVGGERIPYPTQMPLTDDECEGVLEIAAGFKWHHKDAGKLLAGWCAIAPISGALNWRPHLYLTGGPGSGKTTVLNEFVMPVVGESAVKVDGGTTEPGLRSELDGDALPVLIEEAEAGRDMRARENMQQIMEMARKSSASAGGRIAKGSQGGGPSRIYVIRSAFMFVGINPGVRDDADLGRTTFLTLRSSDSMTPDEHAAALEHWRELSEDIVKIMTPDYCQRLRARIVKLAPVIRYNAAKLRDAIAARTGSARVGDQLGHILAGYWALKDEDELDEEQAKQLVARIDLKPFSEAAEAKDHESCLEAIMQCRVSVTTSHGQRPHSIGTCVLRACGKGDGEALGMSESEAENALADHGIRIIGDALAIANRHKEMSRHMRGTNWESGWGQQLKRLPFAVEIIDKDGGAKKLRFGTGMSRATYLRLDWVIDVLS